MYLSLVSKTTISQQPSSDFPGRNKVFEFDFLTESECTSTWENLTDTARITLPKNVYIRQNNKLVTWADKNIIGGTEEPILMRGDKIKIELGYSYFDNNRNEITELNPVFEGYISKVINRMPIELECEDNMFKLKQIAAPNKVFKGYTLQSMLQELLRGTEFKVNTEIITKIGDFRTHNETVAQVLDRLQKELRIESYFRGNELRCSGIVYYESDSKSVIFGFQENIISDELEYRRLDDIKIGVKAFSVNKVELETTRKDGKKVKKKKRISVFVTKDSKGNPMDGNERTFEGEKRTLFLWDIDSKEELFKQAATNLNRFYYEGFYGTFTTFGLPYVKHGDNAIIRDNVLPERNGVYKIKSVKYTFGQSGYRQEIEVDIRVDTIKNAIAFN